MRKAFLLLTVPTLLTACGSPGPGKTYVEMFEKMCSQKSMDPMLEYAAPEAAPLVQMGIEMSKSMDDSGGELEKICSQKLELATETVDGDTAVVMLKSETQPRTMRKVDGKWKLTVVKDEDTASSSKTESEPTPDECFEREMAAARKDSGDEEVPRMVIQAIESACYDS